MQRAAGRLTTTEGKARREDSGTVQILCQEKVRFVIIIINHHHNYYLMFYFPTNAVNNNYDREHELPNGLQSNAYAHFSHNFEIK